MYSIVKSNPVFHTLEFIRQSDKKIFSDFSSRAEAEFALASAKYSSGDSAYFDDVRIVKNSE